MQGVFITDLNVWKHTTKNIIEIFGILRLPAFFEAKLNIIAARINNHIKLIDMESQVLVEKELL